MDLNRYAAFLPTVSDWIHRTLEAHAGEKRPVASFGFSRLPRYFSNELLNSASVVITDPLPVPPLSEMGLKEFAAVEHQPVGGITYLDTIFILPNGAGDESLHFHELIHVIQWRVLGPENFLLLYAAGLAERGYLDSPLEAMAYGHEHRFDAGEPPYLVEPEVRAATLALTEHER